MAKKNGRQGAPTPRPTGIKSALNSADDTEITAAFQRQRLISRNHLPPHLARLIAELAGFAQPSGWVL